MQLSMLKSIWRESSCKLLEKTDQEFLVGALNLKCVNSILITWSNIKHICSICQFKHICSICLAMPAINDDILSQDI